MKRIILFYIFALLIPLSLNSQWSQINSPTANDLQDVFFLNAATGFISGDSVYKTTDGGMSWNSLPTGYDETFYDMHFINDTGIIVGTGRRILKTYNGGLNWYLKAFYGNETIYSITHVLYNGAHYYYAVGESASIFRSVDGGEAFTTIQSPVSGMNDVSFPTDFSHGWICGNSGTIWKFTRDPDTTWTNQSQGMYDFSSISFFNNSYGYVIGSSGILLKTSNGGANWNSLTTNVTSTLNDIILFTSQYAWIAGADGTVLKTSNGGNEWFQQTVYTSNSLNALSIATIAVGYAVGDGGIILKSTNGGGPPMGVKCISNEIPASYELSQNYPNPFNPVTIVKYQIPKPSFVTLTVYDNVGNEITKLINALQHAGTYEVEFNGENLSSGIYYYKITTDKFTASRKMVLIK